MNKILAIDTALEACAVSVANGDQRHTIYEPMGRGQTERIIPMVLEACEAVSVHLSDIEAVCVTRGPGSFTGVRVGLSVARTLASIRGIPLYGLTTFESIMPFMSEGTQNYGIVLESKRDDLYFQMVVNGEPQAPYLTTCADIPTELTLIGNVEALKDRLTPFDLKDITEEMIDLVRAGNIKAGGEKPFYLRDADISKSKKTYRTLSQEVLTDIES